MASLLLCAALGPHVLHLLTLLDCAAVCAQLSRNTAARYIRWLQTQGGKHAARAGMRRDVRPTPTYTPLGELVRALLRRGTATLQDIQHALLVRGQASDLTDDVTHNRNAFVLDLWRATQNRVNGGRNGNAQRDSPALRAQKLATGGKHVTAAGGGTPHAGNAPKTAPTASCHQQPRGWTACRAIDHTRTYPLAGSGSVLVSRALLNEVALVQANGEASCRHGRFVWRARHRGFWAKIAQNRMAAPRNILG